MHETHDFSAPQPQNKTANYLLEQPDGRITVETVGGDSENDPTTYHGLSGPEVLSDPQQGRLAEELGRASLVRQMRDYERHSVDTEHEDSVLVDIVACAEQFSEKAEPLIEEALRAGKQIESTTDEIDTLIRRAFTGQIDKSDFVTLLERSLHDLQTKVQTDEALAAETYRVSRNLNDGAQDAHDVARKQATSPESDITKKTSRFEAEASEILANSNKYRLANDDINDCLKKLRGDRADFASDPNAFEYYEGLFKQNYNHLYDVVSNRHVAVGRIENELGPMRRVPSKMRVLEA